MKIITTFLSLSFLLTQTSCITLFSKKRQDVSIKTTENNATISVQSADLGKDSVSVKLTKDASVYRIEISKEGFKTKNDAIFQTKTNPLLWLDAAALVPPATILGVFGFIIDGGGTKWLSFEKEFKYGGLIEIPKKDEDQRYLYVNTTSIDVQQGDSIGSFYKKYKHFIKQKNEKTIYADDNINYKNTTLTFELNKLLTKYEFYDTVNKIIPNNNNSLFIDAAIEDYHITQIDGAYSSVWQLQLKMNWSFKDSYGEEVYSIKTVEKSDLFKTEYDGFERIINDALDYSLLKTLSHPEVSEKLKVSENELNSNKDLKEIELTNNNFTENSLSNSVKSSVTIKTKDGHGSGFIISNEGHIVSCHHVTAGEKHLKVIFEDGEEFDAEILRSDPKLDLVLLKTKRIDLNPIKISNKRDFDLGSDVFAIGTPESIELGQTLSKGIISGKREANGNTFIQTDVSINSGNSGGAMVNKDGLVLGVVNAKLKGFGVEGIGFAIPSYYIMERLKISFK